MRNDTTKKKEIEQLKDADKKYQSYIAKRNELNDKAKVVREERDMIHESRKDLKTEIIDIPNTRTIEIGVAPILLFEDDYLD